MTRELAITVETVTPVFLGGAQARELADAIRPASVRGQVRYWLRALLGASIDPANPDDALNELKRREGGLMGDTEAGSPVRFRVRRPGGFQFAEAQAQPRGWATGGRRMLPHRAVRNQENPLASDAFVEEQQLDIILSPRPGRMTIPDEVVAATLLWLHLGGLGKRARRGFGSLQPVKFAPSGEGVISVTAREFLHDGRPADAAALRSRINALLGWMGGVTPVPAGSWAGRSGWPVLHEAVAGVRVSDAVKGYNLPKSYHEAMAPFWVESLRADGLRDERAYGYAKPNDRRASPFHLHIARTEAGYHQVITTFWANPSPAGAAGWAKVAALLADVETQFGATTLWGRAS